MRLRGRSEALVDYDRLWRNHQLIYVIVVAADAVTVN